MEPDNTKAELQEALTLLKEVIGGMRNNPVNRAIKFLEKHGIQAHKSNKTYYSVVAERDTLREIVDKYLKEEDDTCDHCTNYYGQD